MIEVNQAWDYIIPIVQKLVWILVGVFAVAALWYWLFVIKKRKFWMADIYEQKSDGDLYLVDKDRLQEKKINRGKQTIYIFRHTKTEAIPPPYECIQRYNNKEYVNYIRILGEYVPMQATENNLPIVKELKTKQSIFKTIKDKLQDIRNIPTTLFNSDSVKNKFIYVPLNKALKYDVDYKPISYDVNMMRINEIDNADIMFANTKNWMEKYGQMVIASILIGGIIVIAYLSFEYLKEVVSQTLGHVNQVVSPLNQIVEKMTGNKPGI